MNEFSKALGIRLREAAERRELSISVVASHLEVSPASVSHYFNGRNEPKFETLLLFSDLVGVSVQDLLNPPSEVARNVEDVDLSEGEFLRIPIRDVDLAAGEGAVPGMEETIGHLAFRADWLRSLSIAPDEASLVRVAGSSMAPTLESGDMLLIDHRRRILIGKTSIFACRLDDTLKVKRVEMSTTDRSVFLHSDNPAVPTEHIPALKTKDFEIIGKVVWSSRTWQDSGY